MGLIVKTIKGNTKQNIVDIAPVTSTAASNPVPEGAKYAFVDKLGGMSVKIGDQIYHGVVDKVVVSDGTTSTDYTIPAALRNLDGYGWGINANCYNYIDFNTMKYHKKLGRVDLGTCRWSYNGTYKTFYTTISAMVAVPSGSTSKSTVLTGPYTTVDRGSIAQVGNTIVWQQNNSEKRLDIRDTSYTDATKFTNAMSGVYLYYELAEEEVTDISDLIPELTVEGMDLVTFHSDNNVDVPNRIRYALPDGNMRQPIVGVEELHFVVKSTGTGETLMTYDLDLDRPMYGIDEACDYMDVDEGTFRQLTEYAGMFDVQYTEPVGPSRPQALFTLTEPAAVQTKVYTETGVYMPYTDIYTNKWIALNNGNNIAVVPYIGINTAADLEKVIERIGVVDALYLRATEASPVDVDEDTLLFLDSLADMDAVTLYITDQDGNPVQYTCALDGLYGVPKLDIVFNGTL